MRRPRGYLREALAGRRRALGNAHQYTAFSLVALASVLDDRARFEEAEPLAREALDILLPAGHWRIALSQSVLGASLAGLRRHAEAEPLLLEGEKGLAESTEASKACKRKAVERLVALYAGWGRPADEARWRAARRDTLSARRGPPRKRATFRAP